MDELNRFTLFDSHFHIIDSRFPLISNQGYLPDNFLVSDYRQRTKDYRVLGGAVVSGSFQGFDQDYLLAALDTLGSGFVGVIQLRATVADEELIRLDKSGVRAVRFNLKRGGSEELTHLDRFARRVYELVGWHVELYVDSKNLAPLYTTLVDLPAVCIDHLGLSEEGSPELLRLVEKGVSVKATGFGRVDFDVATALRQIAAINPEGLLFGTDLPSTRAPRPYSDDDFRLVVETLGEEMAAKIFFFNALNLYRPGAAEQH